MLDGTFMMAHAGIAATSMALRLVRSAFLRVHLSITPTSGKTS